MNISVIRGDTNKFVFYRKDNNGDVIKSQPSAIYFTVKNSSTDKTVVFQKTLNDMTFDSETGKFTFYILPTDTNNLDYRIYEYDLEVKDTIDSIPYTKTIAIGELEIQKEITFASNEV